MLPVKNLEQELSALTDYWSPKVIGRVNDHFVKVAKLKGELCWHKHDEEDELFYILRGKLVIEYENQTVTLNQGDMHIVPRGLMHNPVADEECFIALFEPAETRHTGDIVTEKTRSIEEQLAD